MSDGKLRNFRLEVATLQQLVRKQHIEIEGLHAELDECRRLLREALVGPGMFPVDWYEESARAAGGDDEWRM